MVGTASERAASPVARHVARTAARLFATKGYDATSVREIVEAAGVTKPTLYYHFGSKEGLAQALLHVPLTSLADTLRKVASSRDEPVEVLTRLVETHFAFCREEPDRARFYYAIGFGPLATGLAEDLKTLGRRLDDPIEEVASRLADAGVIEPRHRENLRFFCRGMITSAVMAFLFKDSELGPGVASELVRVLLWGMAKPGTSALKGI